jgi:hypothetical protein
VVRSIERNDGVAVIPSRTNRRNPRDIDRELYKERHMVECLIGKIKEFRRVFARFDKTIISYMANTRSRCKLSKTCFVQPANQEHLFDTGNGIWYYIHFASVLVLLR